MVIEPGQEKLQALASSPEAVGLMSPALTLVSEAAHVGVRLGLALAGRSASKAPFEELLQAALGEAGLEGYQLALKTSL